MSLNAVNTPINAITQNRILKGKVFHSNSKKGIEGANVIVWNTSIRFTTNQLGNFEFEIPDYIQSNIILIEVRKNGLESSMMSIDLSQPGLFIEIKLEEIIRTDKNSIIAKLFGKRKK